MAAYTGFDPVAGSLITDPDDLTYDVDVAFASSTKEIVINTAAKTIALKVNGNLTTDGAVIKAVYSKLKDAWRADATLIKFPFPMGPITDEQFEMINGWNWDKTETSGAADQTTPELLRTGGWSVVNAGGAITEQWFSVITLGTLGETDQVYYQQIDPDTASSNFTLTGPVNQAVQAYSDPNGDGNVADGFDRRTYFKIFVREWAKIYAQSEIADIGVSTVTFQAYRFPLTNSADLKIGDTVENYVGGVATASGSSSGTTATVVTAVAHGFTSGETVVISGVTPAGYNGTYVITVTNTTTFTYTTVGSDLGAISVQGTARLQLFDNIDITYLRDANGDFYVVLGEWVISTAYVVGNVVKGSNDRWYKCTVAGTSAGNSSDLAGGTDTGVTWVAYEGERLIGAIYYPFTVIIDGDTTVAATGSGAARTEEIYRAIQYALRQNSDIDVSSGTVTGKTATALLSFVGDTLVTSFGVYVDSYNTQDTNNITMTTYSDTGTAITVNFPFVAALTVNFGTNLQDDQYAKYWVFFTNAGGNEFGTTSAIIVDDNDGIDMAGDVNPAWPTKRTNVSHSFDYDNNVQGGRTGNTNAPITVVGIGLTTGQYVSATGTIARSTANSVSLVAALERNYSQGNVFP
jgi:hypothetical protein